MTPILEIKNLGKKYNIAHQRGGYIALRDVLMNIVRSPFSFLKSKAKKIAGMSSSEEFWALRNVNLSIEKGEAVGIIGANGAGKSTLLKILSKITPPTEGEIILRGKTASLLEVGTGFHPELSGRENIFLNGAILGMTRAEMAKKFDSIVEFAGVEKFLDTPVKYFSSGMYVRLAFAVAAHLEPDILIIDEVLAVGDAEFQKKCLGKMDEITKKQGRTILFVSHNLEAIRQLCPKCVYLERGEIKKIGNTDEVIDTYLGRSDKFISLEERKDRTGNGKLRIRKIELKDSKKKAVNSFQCGEDGEISLQYEVFDNSLKEISLNIGIDTFPDPKRITLISSDIIKTPIKVSADDPFIKISLKKIPLNAGKYQLTFFAHEHGEIIDWIKHAAILVVIPGPFYSSGNLPSEGTLLLDYKIHS